MVILYFLKHHKTHQRINLSPCHAIKFVKMNKEQTTELCLHGCVNCYVTAFENA